MTRELRIPTPADMEAVLNSGNDAATRARAERLERVAGLPAAGKVLDADFEATMIELTRGWTVGTDGELTDNGVVENDN